MKTLKIVLSKTRKPRLLIFGIKHYQVNLYQVGTNYINGTKNGQAPGVT